MKYLRLKKAKQITAVLHGGKRLYSGTVTLVYAPSDRLSMAVCVGKKFGKSVQRNAIKRLLREAFRACGEFTVPCSVLLIPKVAACYSFHAFRRDIARMLEKDRLIDHVSA